MPLLETLATAATAAAPLVKIGSDLVTSAFNVHESRQNRRFQRDMSNTAHQREVQDLRAAGLNPILSARLGGSSTPGGSAVHLQNSDVGSQLQNSAMAASQMQLMKTQSDLQTAQAEQIRAMTPGAPIKQEAETNQIVAQTALTGAQKNEVTKRLDLIDAQISNLKAQTGTENVKIWKEKEIKKLYDWAKDFVLKLDLPQKQDFNKILESAKRKIMGAGKKVPANYENYKPNYMNLRR